MASEYEKYLWEQTKSDDLSDRGEAYYRLAEQSIYQENPDRALTLNGQARTSYTEAGDSSGLAESRLQTARILIALERPQDAMPELEWCALEYRIDAHESKLAKVAMIEAQALDAMGKTDQAIDDFKSSLRLFISDSNSEEGINCAVSLAVVLNRHKRYEEAQEVLASVTPLIEDNDHAHLVGEHALIGARVQMNLDNRERCFELLDQAQDVFDFVSRDARVHVTQALRVRALNHFGEHVQAIALAEVLGAELVEPSQHFRPAANVRLDIASLEAQSHFALENYEEAERVASKCLSFAKATRDSEHAAAAAWILAQIAQEQGDDELAEKMMRTSLKFNEDADEPIEDRRIKLHLARILIDREIGDEARQLLESFDIHQFKAAIWFETAAYFALLMQAYWLLDNLDQTVTLANLVLQNQLVEAATSASAALAHEFLSQVHARRGDEAAARVEGLSALKMAIELEDTEMAKRLSETWLA